MNSRTLFLRGLEFGSRKIFQILIASVGLLLPLTAFSQLNSGSIAGGITDQSGAVIVGAAVTVTDVERGVSRPLITDSAGQRIGILSTVGASDRVRPVDGNVI
jgi:hypothetical protein